jgi:hypothetical protein
VEAEEKAAQEAESSRPGVGAEVMKNAKALYDKCADNYLIYKNSNSDASAKNTAASAYNEDMKNFESYRAQILKDGTQAELDELHVIVLETIHKVIEKLPQKIDVLPATLSTVSDGE